MGSCLLLNANPSIVIKRGSNKKFLLYLLYVGFFKYAESKYGLYVGLYLFLNEVFAIIW